MGDTLRFCGCWYPVENLYGCAAREYMPQVHLAAHTTIICLTSKTILKQTFINSSTIKTIDQARYTFPLYDGVSVVGFKCQVGARILRGLVKEKERARADYNEAVSRGETAGLLEQLPESSDVFTTRIGNIPAQEKVVVEITYLGELKHDAEVDGVRFTIPTAIAPRYGNLSNSQAGLPADSILAKDKGVIEITVDITVDEASFIKGIQSPSHPIGVSLGRTSLMADDSTDPHRASATLSLGSAHLEKDFVLLVLAKDQDIPRALLETHPNLPNQRALMATLVPRFNLPPSRPEIVFVVDRSGSMRGKKITTVVSALKVFLKSLPVGVKFNICSFGSQFSFLWPRSKSYDKSSLEEASAHVNTFGAEFGGTEMFQPVVQTVKQRYQDMQLEVMLLTDGQMWQQQSIFDFINETVSKEPVRFFSLGIGNSVSHSLVEGIARAGNGFAQFVGEDEKLDKKVVRMVKGALTPHIKDYTLEVKYEESIEDGYEMVEKVTEGLRVLVTDPDREKGEMQQKPTISLFDPSIKSEDEKQTSKQTGQDRYSHLPTIAPPKLLQAPSQIPPLYPFIRSSVYLLMSSEACQMAPKSVILRAISDHGPLELEIGIQDVGKGETIHRLAAKKAMTELEEGRGWIVEAKGDDDKILKERFDGRWDEIVQREAVRLGVDFQVAGKWCSFVAVQKNIPGVGEEAADLNPSAQTLSGGESECMNEVDIISGGGAASSGGGVKSHARGGRRFAACALTSGARPLQPLATVARRGSPPPIDRSGNMQQLMAGRDGRQSSAMRVSGLVSPGSSQRQAKKTSFLAPGSASQIPETGSVYFGSKSGGVQPLTLDSFCMGGVANTSQVPAAGSVQFESHGRPGSPMDGSFESNKFMPKRRMLCMTRNKRENDMDVDVNANGIVRDRIRASEDGLLGTQDLLSKFQSLETPVDRMHALIALQGFDGSWEWSDELLKVVGLTEKDVTSLQGDRATMATVLAVAFFERKVPGEKETWELVVDKARGWLKTKAVDVEVEVERVAALWS